MREQAEQRLDKFKQLSSREKEVRDEAYLTKIHQDREYFDLETEKVKLLSNVSRDKERRKI